MSSRSTCWFACIFVTAVVATDYSDTDFVTVWDPEVKAIHSRTDMLESSRLVPDEEVEQTEAVDLSTLLDAGDGAVLTLVAGDTRLVAHRAVLAARSPVFATMFRHGTLKSRNTPVVVPDMEGPVLRQLLTYMYTLRAPQLPGMAVQLLIAADRYSVLSLKAACEQQLVAQLSVENVVATAMLAGKHSLTCLRQAAIAFIRAHIFEVLGTKGWTDTMHTQPEDLIEVIRLLSGPPAETSVPATQPHGDQSDRSGTPAAAEPPTAVRPTPPPGDTGASCMWTLSQEEKDRRLIEAAKQGAVEELQALLAAGANVTARSEYRQTTALHWAAERGDVEVVKMLLAAGAEVDARSTQNQDTPMIWAVWNGHADVVRLLVAAHADLSAANEGGLTPLHCAARRGYPEVAKVLLEAGADRWATSNDGHTPLDVARLHNFPELIQILSPSTSLAHLSAVKRLRL
ncbi:tonsoku-like protein [Schistocerca cancellata]|uniref:tonsoku-like protein n=1 Tax=Schistocerca cancellata TaxID=274614 RepID=UPI002119570C|nr:tonsoku-like protein [Schistocerca cancellata]